MLWPAVLYTVHTKYFCKLQGGCICELNIVLLRQIRPAHMRGDTRADWIYFQSDKIQIRIRANETELLRLSGFGINLHQPTNQPSRRRHTNLRTYASSGSRCLRLVADRGRKLMKNSIIWNFSRVSLWIR